MAKRLLQTAAVGVCSLTMMAASNYDRLGHGLLCQCGCGQILLDCNHVGCPVSPVMISELQKNLAAGMSNSQVLNWFVNKYGPVVLAAPVRGGFDTVAWIVPFAVLLLGIAMVVVLLRLWKTRRAAAGVPAAMPDAPSDDVRKRIRDETNYE